MSNVADTLAVDVRGLVKSYSGTQVVRGIDLAIRHGEVSRCSGRTGRARPLRSRFSRATGPVTTARSAFLVSIPAVSGQG
jgi:ABC-type lipopolysaccharide export system ATPase subunit